MKKQTIQIFIITALALTLSACGNNTAVNPPSSSVKAEYKKITAEEAEQMMNDDVIILDVRTKEEYDESHIPNAVLIPNTDIANKADVMLADKEQTILVYCRSGNRSASAAKELISMGYKNVYDFGGINDWMGEVTTAT